MTEHKPITTEELDSIVARATAISRGPLSTLVTSEDVPRLVAEVRRLNAELRRIWEYPNSEADHHPDECELRTTPPDEHDEETICTCGYWSASFPQLKIQALAALKGR